MDDSIQVKARKPGCEEELVEIGGFTPTDVGNWMMLVLRDLFVCLDFKTLTAVSVIVVHVPTGTYVERREALDLNVFADPINTIKEVLAKWATAPLPIH